MNRPCLIRGVRIAWSVVWGILCVLLIVLWVRSYSRLNSTSLVPLMSMHGEVWAISVDTDKLPPEDRESTAKRLKLEWEAFKKSSIIPISKIHIQGGTKNRSRDIVVHLVPIALSASLVAAPWLCTRFSLRTLLFVTTLIAVVLGLVVYASR
jgi:hypothetical protein